MHHTKTKGDFGVLKAMTDCHEQGFDILTPFSEHLPFDFVAYKDGKFIRIQAKYRAALNGKIELQFKTGWNDKNGHHTKLYELERIDFFCIYCPDTNECYYLPVTELNKNSITLRISPCKTNQTRKINNAKDYRSLPQ